MVVYYVQCCLNGKVPQLLFLFKHTTRIIEAALVKYLLFNICAGWTYILTLQLSLDLFIKESSVCVGNSTRIKTKQYFTELLLL